jgi:hypothetical protein
MKKSLWVGFVGFGNQVAVGYDGTNLRIACNNPKFEAWVKKQFFSEMIRNMVNDDDFDFGEYVGSSSAMSSGESSDWDEEEFKKAMRLIKSFAPKEK